MIPTRQNQNMDPNLEAIFKPLLQEVALLTLKWQNVRELFVVSRERVEILNRTAGGFFGLVQITFRDDAFLALSRLTDPLQSGNKDNLTILRLLEHLDKNRNPTFYESLEKQTATAIERCKPFRLWRNKKLAHSDLGTALKFAPEPLPGVSVKEVNEAVQSLQIVMNSFNHYFFDTTTVFDSIIQSGGPDRLIHHLRKGLEAGEKELEDKINFQGLTGGSS